ncbi:phage tail fiber protein [Singulisphaera sp. PoT]|uniref:phage tail fiber protein n=1 Tax=Singulisphaera sp. PoT TaxID=3411797 RepID=UPI003BF4A63D
MAQDISGFGLVATITASNTFPAGFPITQFADDSDPLDMASIQIADKAMGLNGDLITWARAMPIPAVIAVIPGSIDDINLGILAEANRAGQGKVSANDVINMTVVYPDGSAISVSQGRLTDAMFGKSVASSGRLKTKIYSFSFQNKVGS